MPEEFRTRWMTQKKFCIEFDTVFEVFTAGKFPFDVCWVVTPCSDEVGPCRLYLYLTFLRPEDGGSKILRNVGILL
jgi:hypothetical protein